MKHLPIDTPKEVKARIQSDLEILDSLYGATRDIKGYGGYICYIPKNDDYKVILNEREIDLESGMVEMVNTIHTDEGDYISILYLINSDYGIVIIMDKTQAPTLLQALEE
jgi:hypothetical protein